MRDTNTIHEAREAFFERVRKLGADIHFTGGLPERPRIEGDLAIMVDRASSVDAGLCHRVTVCAGLPPPLEVIGLLCTLRKAETNALVQRATTDRRGQVRLAPLKDIQYRLDVEPRPSFPIPEESLPYLTLLAEAPRWEKADRLFLDFQTPDGNYGATISQTREASREVVLRVDVDPEVLEEELLGVKVHDRAGRPVALGCVALRTGLAGRKTGEVLLGPLCLPSGERKNASLTPFYLTLDPCLVKPGEDIDLLERSLKATTDAHSRMILEQALKPT